jgi:hypothetical protein
MKTNKMKKWGRRIILGLLISLTVSVIAPTILGDNLDTSNHTAYAATCTATTTTDTCDVATAGDLKDKCPDKYTIDAAKKICTKNAAATTTDKTQVLKMMNFLIALQDILNKLLWPVLVMIGGLIDNSLLFGNGMEERLREIWIPIRNIVNILFVVALVAIALYNVLGIGDENSNYSIKAILPKIIVGIIVVNFSFLGIKVFLDGINVLTSAIFALPNQVGADTLVLDPERKGDQEIIDKYCRTVKDKEYNETIDYVAMEKEDDDRLYKRVAQSDKFKTYFEGKIEASTTAAQIEEMVAGGIFTGTDDESDILEEEWDKTIAENENGKICVYDKEKKKFILTNHGQLFLKRWNARNSSLAMALGLSKIVLYKEINIGSLGNIDKLLINSALSLLLYILFVASFMALFVVLLGRLVVMWLAIALSPVLLLTMAIPAIKENVSGFGDITSQFVQNAIAPLGIALSLSIGWIMLKALQGVNSLYGGEQISFTAAEGIPVVGLTSMQDLIVGVGTIAVIWLGVFTAASKTIAGGVTDWMKSGLMKAGSWVGTLPLKHAPLFHIDLPGVKGDENYTGTQMLEAVGALGGRPKNAGVLADLLTGQKRIGVNDFGDRKVKTKEDVVSLLSSARSQNMSGADLQKGMKKLENRNSKLYHSFKGDTKYGDLHAKMEAMKKAKKPEEVKAAGEALRDHHAVKGHVAPAASTSKKGPTVVNVKSSVEIDGVPIGDKNAALKPLLGNLSSDLGAGAEKGDIDSKLKAVKAQLPPPKNGSEYSATEVKHIRERVLGDAMVKDLEKVYNGKTGLDNAIKAK